MTVKRSDVDNPATYRAYGKWFAHESLIEQFRNVAENDTVEIDYVAPSDIEVSRVGTVRRVSCVNGRKDEIWIDCGAQDAYLHINPSTGDVFFSPPNRKRGQYRLLQLDVR